MAPLTSTASLRGPTGLDRGAREALLRTLIESGLQHTQLVVGFFRREAYGNLDDYLAAVRNTYGFEAAESIRTEMRMMTDRYIDPLRLDWQQAARDSSHTYGPIGFLMAMPEADFFTTVEAGVGLVPNRMRTSALPKMITRICERRGIPYRMTSLSSGARFEWSGDTTIAEQVVSPALSALEDPRLVHGPKVEFDGARDQLRQNSPESRKRAVGEACSAVESTMKVALVEHGRPLPKPAVLSKLVEALIAEGLVEGELKEMLVAPGFYGNRKSRHGGGPHAHDVSEQAAEAAVAAAAVAITYLAAQLA